MPPRNTDYTLRFSDPNSRSTEPTRTDLDALRTVAYGLTDGGGGPDNDRIPAGYTYLLQFVSHDISWMDIPRGSERSNVLALRNRRTPRFDLDSLYGRGPVFDPQLYLSGTDSYKLALRKNQRGAFDLLRRNDRISRRDDDLKRWRPAVIADPRNDENIIISQLHVAMIRLHNKFLNRQAGRSLPEAFAVAQRLTRWHYQYVIVEDLLPRLCPEPSLLTRLKRELTQRRDPSGNAPPLPLEFSLAAFRVGHSMIRETYRLNQKLTKPGSRELWDLRVLSEGTPRFSLNGGRMLPKDWTVQWDQFADFKGSDPQPALKFDTLLARPLRRIPIGFPVPVRLRNLAYLDLLRGATFGLADGHYVARQLGQNAFAPDGPLWLYFLREAEAQQSGGETLGPVAAQITAETIYELMWSDLGSYFHDQSGFAAELQSRDFDFAALLKLSGAPMTIDDLPR